MIITTKTVALCPEFFPQAIILSRMKNRKRPVSFSFEVRETLRLPIFFFMLAGSFAAWQSFYNVHLDRIGFSSMQIGALNAIFISTSAVVVPFWGMLADRIGNNRILLLLTAVCSLFVFLIGQTLAFHWMVIFIFVISVFHQPGGAVTDGMAMGFVRTNPQYTYGQFRLWGSAGYAIASLVVGYLARENTQVIFNLAALMFLLLSVSNLITLPSRPVVNRNLVNFRSFAVFFRNRRLLEFLMIIMMYGLAISPLHQFINLYYKDIGAGNSFIGTVFFIQAAFEVPLFLVGARLARRIGPERVILIAMATSMLRMILYGLITSPEIAIFLSAFHGITIAFFLIGVVEYVQSHTPFHLRTTGQALIWAFHFGAGVTLGNLVLGYLRDHTGMLGAMHIHSGIAAVMLIWGIVFFRRSLRSG